MKTKLDHAAPAAELYVSPLFKARKRYVEQSCDRWFVLSARHGVLDPDDVIEPYDERLADQSAEERRHWSSNVIRSLEERLGPLNGVAFEIHAGAAYVDFGVSEQLGREGAHVERPAQGLGLGEQLGFYAGREVVTPSRQKQPPLPKTILQSSDLFEASYYGIYEGLHHHLRKASGSIFEASFGDIEQMLGRPLPSSSRRHRAWWANDPTHSHAKAWLAAGWMVEMVNLGREQVRFTRDR